MSTIVQVNLKSYRGAIFAGTYLTIGAKGELSESDLVIMAIETSVD